MPVLEHIPPIGIITKIRIISLLIFLVPVYFFSIGDFYGSGFQTPLFRYQDVFLGSFLVLVSNDLNSVITGFFQGMMAASVLLWLLGSVFLIINIVLLFADTTLIERTTRRSGILIIVSGIFFLLSILVHYGPLLHNTLGIAIPLGLPLIFLIGIWMYLWKEPDNKIDQAGTEVQSGEIS
jgi:hypothetical protein